MPKWDFKENMEMIRILLVDGGPPNNKVEMDVQRHALLNAKLTRRLIKDRKEEVNG